MLLLRKQPSNYVGDAPLNGRAIEVSEYTRASAFFLSSRKIMQFSSNNEPKPSDKIVYVSGAFDLFHIGHIRFLKRARKLGDYLICGIHSDADVAHVRGVGNPLCNLHERTLGVLQCKYVDECVIGAPYALTEVVLTHFNVHVVAYGGASAEHAGGLKQYQPAIEAGILQKIDSGSALTAQGILRRILENHLQFELRNQRKNAKELRIQAAPASREAA